MGTLWRLPQNQNAGVVNYSTKSHPPRLVQNFAEKGNLFPLSNYRKQVFEESRSALQ